MDDGRGDSGRTESLRASEDLGDAENKLDDMIAKLIGLRIEVEDPDGLARFPLGDDGRLLTLFATVPCAPRLLTSAWRSSTTCSQPVTGQCGCRARSFGALRQTSCPGASRTPIETSAPAELEKLPACSSRYSVPGQSAVAHY